VEQGCPFRSRVTFAQPFKGIPENRVGARSAVNGEITLEHAALGAKILDAGPVIWPDRCSQLSRTCRRLAFVPSESGHRQAASTEFDENVWAIRKPGHVILPSGKHPFPVFSIRTDTQRASHMVQYDGETRMCLREIRQFRDLRVKHPGIETQSLAFQTGQSCPELRTLKKMTGWIGVRVVHPVAGIPGAGLPYLICLVVLTECRMACSFGMIR